MECHHRKNQLLRRKLFFGFPAAELYSEEEPRPPRISSGWFLSWLVLGSLFCFVIQCSGAAGDLDISFGSGGKVLTPVSNGRANAVAIQPDGKIVAAGIGRDGASGDFALTRYNIDGSL